jgi:hypothetical protein
MNIQKPGLAFSAAVLIFLIALAIAPVRIETRSYNDVGETPLIFRETDRPLLSAALETIERRSAEKETPRSLFGRTETGITRDDFIRALLYALGTGIITYFIGKLSSHIGQRTVHRPAVASPPRPVVATAPAVKTFKAPKVTAAPKTVKKPAAKKTASRSKKPV